jgi:predicted AAA+ superfamily ATPase
VAITNRDRIGKALELFGAQFAPYVDRRMTKRSPMGGNWKAAYADEHLDGDPQVLVNVVFDHWDVVFKQELKGEGRNYLNEVRAIRNTWAHQLGKAYSFDDTYRALDTIERMLRLIDADGAEEVTKAKTDLMKLRAAEEARFAKTKGEATLFGEVQGLPPWREVIQPHDDVAQGRFSAAEFAADLHQVRHGLGAAEYTDPVEFFRRTYLTSGLSKLLRQAAQRITGETGAPPVIDLQTTFGGGKTHSMIALYHLCSGRQPGELAQDVHELLTNAGVTSLPPVARAVVVGTRMSPGQPMVKDDGTEVRTLWGELAWQLGGRAAYDVIAESDRTAMNPGDHFRRLLEAHAPALILIDEWIAYAAQLVGESTPAGSFDTQFYFAQTLTEVVKSVPGCLLVVSLPASVDAAGVETSAMVGGPAGHEALARLRNAVGRMKDAWQPATAEESFEIVRRRLFKPVDPSKLKFVKATARQFVDYYAANSTEFPSEVKEKGYGDQIEAAYPVHPELFERLYNDWSTLDRFQRTRGVLRLMALVVHALWARDDRSPVILPASLPLDDAAVAAELISNLDERWPPIVQRDVDGSESVPRRLDAEFPNLGKHAATRRAARCVFLGSAPLQDSANRGLEIQRVRLGSALPGDPLAVFADALSRLSDRATYLYTQGSRYWYGTQPGVGQLARDRAEQWRSGRHHEVQAEIRRRVEAEVADRGLFRAVHVMPETSGDVSDTDEVRLVVLDPAHAHVARSDASAAIDAARALLEQRGPSPRLNKNDLVYLVCDHKAVDPLEQAAAEYLAWKSIDEDRVTLNLDEHNKALAATKKADADKTVRLRLREAFVWVLVPSQDDPLGPIGFDAVRADGADGLAVRAGAKLKNQGHVALAYSAEMLRTLLDGVLAPLWEGGHTTVNALWESLCRYPYLPRLATLEVLADTVRQGAGQLLWQSQGWAVADGFDAATGRYLGLTVEGFPPSVVGTTLVVRPDVAARQREQEVPAVPAGTQTDTTNGGTALPDSVAPAVPPVPAGPAAKRRFYGVVALDVTRLGRDFTTVNDEVIGQLARLMGTQLTVKVEIEATNDTGFDPKTVRDVSENATTLKFDQHDFE